MLSLLTKLIMLNSLLKMELNSLSLSITILRQQKIFLLFVKLMCIIKLGRLLLLLVRLIIWKILLDNSLFTFLLNRTFYLRKMIMIVKFFSKIILIFHFYLYLKKKWRIKILKGKLIYKTTFTFHLMNSMFLPQFYQI